MKPHVRRHGPHGYSEYGHYRNWLRDEFTFRCIYCLRRETWLTLQSDYEIDHFLPKCEHPDIERDYDNLVYACSRCNRTKAAKYLPSPESLAYGNCMSVDKDGEIHALDDYGVTIIEALGLDAPDYTDMRRSVLDFISEAPLGGKILKRLLGYPETLPDLTKERPPKYNTRENGLCNSYFARKSGGKLAEYF
jgi:hypothetical protein